MKQKKKENKLVDIGGEERKRRQMRFETKANIKNMPNLKEFLQ